MVISLFICVSIKLLLYLGTTGGDHWLIIDGVLLMISYVYFFIYLLLYGTSAEGL